MALKRTTALAVLSGICSLAIVTMKFSLRSYTLEITMSNFEMFSTSTALQVPPYNGTLLNAAYFFHYIHSVKTSCNKLYLVDGPSCHKHSDSELQICLEETTLPQKNNCIVYSIGIENQLFFEDNLFMAFECEIHIFDPSTRFQIGNQRITEREIYHPIGDGNGYIHKETLRKELKHRKQTDRKVDIVKMDLWGQEWKVLEILLMEDIIDRVNQITFSSHLDILKILRDNEWIPFLENILEMLQELDARGLKKVHYIESTNILSNVLIPTQDRPFPTCGKLLFIRN